MDELPLSENHRVALNGLREEFAEITDLRQPGKVRHALPEVLLGGLCAMICGCDNYSAMAEFAKLRLEWLREFLPMEAGAPSRDTFRNVFMMVRPGEFTAALRRLFGPTGEEHLSIDGMAIRSSFDRERGKCLVHLLRAWIDERSHWALPCHRVCATDRPPRIL